MPTLVARTPQHRAHARHELARRERLHDVVVGAELEPDDAVRLVAVPAQHDHRHRVVGAHLSQHVEAAHLRETEVEHDELGLIVGDLVERGRAVTGVVDRVPLTLERGADDVDEVEVVVDDEDHAPGG